MKYWVETGEAKSKMIYCGLNIPKKMHRTWTPIRAGESLACNKEISVIKKQGFLSQNA